MNSQDHMALRLARLKSSEELEQNADGLFFIFSKAGIGRYSSKAATHRLSPGDILVFHGVAGSKVAVFDGKGEFLFWTFSVCFEHLLPLFDSHEISNLHHITEGFKAGKVYPAGSPTAAECHRLLEVVPSQLDLNHRGQLIRIAATVLSGEVKELLSARSGNSRPDDHMVRVFEKLSASELINLSVGELADRFSCSRRHLNRLFHQHFGASVAALRMEMRLLKAVSLLRDKNAKVINVAEQCGFNHLGLFNTCFKRRFGTTPGQWRNSATQPKDAPAGKPKNKPTCSMRSAGLCPFDGSLEASIPEVVTACAEKLPDGVNVLGDLNRSDLLFGDKSLTNIKRPLPRAGGGR